MGKSIILSACLLLVCWTPEIAADPFVGRLSAQVGIGGDGFAFSAEFSGDVLLLRDAEVIPETPQALSGISQNPGNSGPGPKTDFRQAFQPSVCK